MTYKEFEKKLIDAGFTGGKEKIKSLWNDFNSHQLADSDLKSASGGARGGEIDFYASQMIQEFIKSGMSVSDAKALVEELAHTSTSIY